MCVADGTYQAPAFSFARRYAENTCQDCLQMTTIILRWHIWGLNKMIYILFTVYPIRSYGMKLFAFRMIYPWNFFERLVYANICGFFYICWFNRIYLCSENWRAWCKIMTSSNGNTFHVTGHLCGEVTGEFPSQRPVTQSFDVFLDLRLE